MATAHRWPRILSYDESPYTPFSGFTVEFTSTYSETYIFQAVDEMTFVMMYIEPVLEEMRNEAKIEEGWRMYIRKLEARKEALLADAVHVGPIDFKAPKPRSHRP